MGPNNTNFGLITITITLIVIILVYFKWTLSYWQRKGLKSLPTSIIFGNCRNMLLGHKTIGEQFLFFYEQFKKQKLHHAGIYMGVRPIYFPIDPEIIKNITQKDSQHFMSHGIYVNEENDPLSGTLFNLEKLKWKNIRTKLTPTFTSGKMKMMFNTMTDCAQNLKDTLNESQQTSIDIKEILARFTTDVIGTCAFGIECNTLKNPNSEFRKYGKRMIEHSFYELLKINLQFALPSKLLDFIKYKSTKRDVEDFIMRIVKETVEYRETNQLRRNDFMHLLLQLKNHGTISDDDKINNDKRPIQNGLTLNEVAAHSFVFFTAGFETSSTTMTFALLELGLNREIQEKLRQEIITVLNKYNNEICYDAITEMTYMDKVIYETLRKYAIVPVLFRRCTKDYIVPGTDMALESGTDVIISIWGLHRDPEYYPDPERFDPERFSEKEKNKRPNFTFLPFGEGPRTCIGMRFGLMQTKIGLITILKNFIIKINRKTQMPIQIDKQNFFTTAKGGIWLDIESV